MKIIGIFGGSGSGKTTVTQMLHKKTNNSIILALDAFMHKHFDEHKQEILDRLNVKEDENIWWYNYILSSIDNAKKAINIIEPYIEEDIAKCIIENKKYDLIIIDWAFLPLISTFTNCDFAISISSDLDTKINRLSARLDANNKLQKWPKSALIERINNTSLNQFGYKAKYDIKNSGTLEELSNNLNKILLKENIDFNVDSDEVSNVIYWDMDR